LPPAVDFVLFFDFRAEEIFSGKLSDGGILLSKLDYDMQKATLKMCGFKEDYDSILSSPATIRELNILLDKAADLAKVQSNHD
jgi:hypothetical protein